MTSPRAGKLRELVVGVVMPVVGFSLYCDLLALADWGQGIERFTAIAFGAGVAWLLPPVRFSQVRPALILLTVIAAALLTFRSYEAVRSVVHADGPAVDVGTTTIVAIDLVRRGEDPYATFIDPNGASTNPDGEGFDYAAGFKYGPVMIWSYMPAVAFLGPDGYFVMNWIALVATAVAALLLLWRTSGPAAGIGVFLLTLMPGILGRELFEAGFNDIVPVAFAVFALVLRERDFPVAAGVTLGLSIATKSIPGVIVALPLLMMFERDRGRFALSVTAAALAGHLPWLVTSTPELIAGLVSFNLTRTVDDTSLLHWIPDLLRLPFTVLVLSSVLVLSTNHALSARRSGMASFLGLIAAALAVSFAASPAVHGNYLLWYFPFIALAVASRLWSWPGSGSGPTELV